MVSLNITQHPTLPRIAVKFPPKHLLMIDELCYLIVNILRRSVIDESINTYIQVKNEKWFLIVLLYKR
jgi:hypothetical protein